MPISTFDSTPVAPPAGADASRSALSNLLSALSGTTAAGVGVSAQFSDLLGMGAPAAPGAASSAAPDGNRTPDSATPAIAAGPAATSGLTVLTPGLRMVLAQLQAADNGTSASLAVATLASAAGTAATKAVAKSDETAGDATTESVRLPTRDELEQALALLAPLLAQLTASPAVPVEATSDQVSVSLQSGAQTGLQPGAQLNASLSQLTGTGNGAQALQQLADDLLAMAGPAATGPAATGPAISDGTTAPASGTDPVAAFTGENFESDPTMSALSQAMRLLVRADTFVRSPLPLGTAPMAAAAAADFADQAPAAAGTVTPVAADSMATPTPMAGNSAAVAALSAGTISPGGSFSPPAAVSPQSPVRSTATTDSDGDDASPTSTPSVSAQVQLGGALLTVTMAGSSGQGTNSGTDSGNQEKNAAATDLVKLPVLNVKPGTEKQVLSIYREKDKTSEVPSGIAIAKKGDVMSSQTNIPHRSTVDLPISLPGERAVASGVTLVTGKSSEGTTVTANPVALPTSSLAHQAVETVQTLVATQREQAAQGGVVTLNFKFGQDDLSVRVQLRAGEVRTQFSTNSPELRAALTTEWQSANRSVGVAGLRLAEPDFVPAAGSTGSQTGGFAQGQFSSQQQAQQQAQTPASALLPELRALRPLTTETPAADTSASITVVQPTSLHLTAVA